MKKITLILSIMLIWGCSQAQEQDAEAKAKKVVAEQAEVVKDEAIEQANELTSGQVEAVAEEAVSEVKQAIEEVKDVAETVDEAVEDVVAPVVEKMNQPAKFQAGIHYQVLNPVYETGIDDEVVVYEFFG